jgi:hypothetical protein
MPQSHPTHLADTTDARSGPLSQRDLPAPEDLGGGWRYRVDRGDPEEGYVGSGEPAIARDPESVIDAITPLGCQPQQLPKPEHALEVTYRRAATPGVGLVLQFASSASADRFFATHSDVVTGCVDSRKVNIRVLTASENVLLSTRTEQLGQTPTWVEGARLEGRTVTLIAVADPSRRGIDALTSAMRAAPQN